MPARPFVTGNFQLVLDGATSGFLKSVDGGAAVAEVLTETVGDSQFSKKHIGQISYSPIVLEFGTVMTTNLYDWIAASWSGKPVAKDGAIMLSDQDNVAVSQREFVQAFLTETTIPALGGAGKEPGYLTMKLAPEYTRTTKASGKVTAPAKVKQRPWQPANFRVTIGDLDCTRVSRVEAFTIKQPVATADIGDKRRFRRAPTRLEFPDLSITLAEASAQSWFDWFDDFVIKGNNDESREKSGSLSLLSVNMAEELLRIDLFNLGIFRIGSGKSEANSDKIATVTADLYCERMELHAGSVLPAVTRQARAPKSKAKRRK